MKKMIEVDRVSMRLNLAEEKTDTIKEYFLKMIRGQLHFSEFYALRNVSFCVERGEAVALVGVNGSGKSTMLKIIAGVMYPTKGSIAVHGSIAPLIELGAGFDPELTARENIFLNGAILGHDRSVMESHFNEIMDFAELWDFLDVPMKNYSSGMTARLGFSIATAISTDILIVDEILAVGDFAFQHKCRDRIQELLALGTTLLFVSHNFDEVRRLCNRAIWLNKGCLIEDGDCEKVIKSYRDYVEGKEIRHG